jgi:EF-hand domain pair
MRVMLSHCVLLASCAGVGIALAQNAGGSDTATTRRARGYDALVAWATTWGDLNHTGVYTCDEWKRYATRLFNEADKNHDGFVSAQEFKAIQQADVMLKNADLAYFDDNRDGRLSRSEFVDKPNQFFARYDRKGECRVTLDNIADPAAETKRDGRMSR